MRQVINISLPKQMVAEVNKAVKEEKFASKSEFFRHLIRLWEEEKLHRNIMESEKEFSQKRGRVLRSLKDLM